jgi:hypothetical protein
VDALIAAATVSTVFAATSATVSTTTCASAMAGPNASASTTNFPNVPSKPLRGGSRHLTSVFCHDAGSLYGDVAGPGASGCMDPEAAAAAVAAAVDIQRQG